jgi:hypothetical protein
MKTKKQEKRDLKEQLKVIPQEKKSKFVLWQETIPPKSIEIVDMRAVLK